MNGNGKQLKTCLQLAENYCIKREHCCSEIKEKLENHCYTKSIIETVLTKLQETNFINEERYATAYINDKLLFRKWGKLKIKQMLRSKKISENIIQNAISMIGTGDYKIMINDLILKKSDTLKEKNPLRRKQKLLAFAISKGFEKSMVWEVMKEGIENK